MTNASHAVSDASAEEAFEGLKADDRARLVDVRTRAEWVYVGVPLVEDGREDPLFLQWQTFPEMSVDEGFGTALSQRCPDTDAPLYFLCRSGARSLAAAREMASRGYTRCFNVADGFEGPPDEDGHRGRIAGWKAAGLPWRQS